MTPSVFAEWLEMTPLWAIGASLLASMLVAGSVGSWLRKRVALSATGSSSTSGFDRQEGYLVSGVLGLLALLTGFTFALAVDRFEIRRELVLKEANAIGTTYLRTQVLDRPHRERISQLLIAYTDNRIAIATANPRDAADMLAANDAPVTNLWSATVATFPSIRGMDFSSSYLDTMNKVIELDASRKTARRTKVPSTVFFVLFVYMDFTAAVLGYVLAGLRGRIAAAFLFVLYTMSLLLVIDIDRPVGGRISESQDPMQRLRESLKAHPPPDFDSLTGVAPSLP